MYRSFTDRILGGVCGGLGVDLRINPWLLRAAFVILTIISLGVGALVYLALWWALPQESLIKERRGSFTRLLVVGLIFISMFGAWFGHQMGWLRGPSGQEVFWPVILLVLSVIFLVRQVRA